MTNSAPPPQGVTIPPTHRVAIDSWGYYCLACNWPGWGFTSRYQDAVRHRDTGR